jgi:hypothetical protein
VTSTVVWAVYVVVVLVALTLAVALYRERSRDRDTHCTFEAEQDDTAYFEALQPHTVPTPTLRRGPDGRFPPRTPKETP